MDINQEFNRLVEILKDEAGLAYKAEIDGEATFEVSVGKNVTIKGGQEKLQDLKDGYDSLFVDPETPNTEGAVKQFDGTLVMCTQAEWDELLKQMRLAGRVLFEKHETLLAQIGALTANDTFTTIVNTTWENM